MTTEDPRDALDLRRVQPVVRRPKAGLPPALLFGIAAVAAVLLFVALEARRRSAVDTDLRPSAPTSVAITSPPPLDIPAALPVAPQPVVEPARPVVTEHIGPLPRAVSPVIVQQAAPPPPSFQPVQLPPVAQRPALDGAGALIIDTTQGNATVALNGGPAKEQPGAADGDEAVRPTLIRNRSSIVAQGTLIAAVLETPLNSDRPGPARAVIAKDAYGFDGSRVLIPRGSRLIGEFKAEAGENQRRILVNWTRLIRPDGVAMRIGSTGGDALGGAGIPGKVNTHFLERFSNAVLQSAFEIGVNLASRPAAGSIYVGAPSQLSSAGQTLFPNTRSRTTIKVKSGAEISIFVAHDLDFAGTPAVR